MKGIVYQSVCLDPYWNLALEEYLLSAGLPVLYLWQNDNTVVIGRNQNAYTECDMDYVKTAGIHVVRRLSGGGAVFHDRGNLNYSLILPQPIYDITRSTRIIIDALKLLGIPVVANGRNDIILNGKKISGNAYYSGREAGLHHGTILYRADPEKMERVLSVPDWKQTKHGIHSVKARITDIVSQYPGIEMTDIQEALQKTFCREYGISQQEDLELDREKLRLFREKYVSKSWNLNRINEYEIFRVETFSWGTAKVSVNCVGKKVLDIAVSSDSLEADLVDEVRDRIRRNETIEGKEQGIVSDILSVYHKLMKEFLNGKKHENAPSWRE